MMRPTAKPGGLLRLGLRRLGGGAAIQDAQGREARFGLDVGVPPGGNSAFWAGGRISMLPEQLSNGLRRRPAGRLPGHGLRDDHLQSGEIDYRCAVIHSMRRPDP